MLLATTPAALLLLLPLLLGAEGETRILTQLPADGHVFVNILQRAIGQALKSQTLRGFEFKTSKSSNSQSLFIGYYTTEGDQHTPPGPVRRLSGEHRWQKSGQGYLHRQLYYVIEEIIKMDPTSVKPLKCTPVGDLLHPTPELSARKKAALLKFVAAGLKAIAGNLLTYGAEGVVGLCWRAHILPVYDKVNELELTSEVGWRYLDFEDAADPEDA